MKWGSGSYEKWRQRWKLRSVQRWMTRVTNGIECDDHRRWKYRYKCWPVLYTVQSLFPVSACLFTKLCGGWAGCLVASSRSTCMYKLFCICNSILKVISFYVFFFQLSKQSELWRWLENCEWTSVIFIFEFLNMNSVFITFLSLLASNTHLWGATDQ